MTTPWRAATNLTLPGRGWGDRCWKIVHTYRSANSIHCWITRIDPSAKTCNEAGYLRESTKTREYLACTTHLVDPTRRSIDDAVECSHQQTRSVWFCGKRCEMAFNLVAGFFVFCPPWKGSRTTNYCRHEKRIAPALTIYPPPQNQNSCTDNDRPVHATIHLGGAGGQETGAVIKGTSRSVPELESDHADRSLYSRSQTSHFSQATKYHAQDGCEHFEHSPGAWKRAFARRFSMSTFVSRVPDHLRLLHGNVLTINRGQYVVVCAMLASSEPESSKRTLHQLL